MQRLLRVLLPLLIVALVATVAPAPSAAAGGRTGHPKGEARQRASWVDHAARAQFEWVVSLIDGRRLSKPAYVVRFDRSFREALPLSEARAVLDDLRAAAPYTVDQVDDAGEGVVEAVVTGADGVPVAVTLTVARTGRIAGLVFQPLALPEPPTTIDEAADRLASLGTLRLVAADVDGTSCEPTVARDADEPAPIGSAFKLYVLAAVADAVEADTLAWDDELTITAEVKSLPSGVLQDRPDGSTVTVREAAELMVSISDNTATDLLMQAVGREAVEAAQATTGHATPELNVPMLTTRELFLLKGGPEERRQRWIEAGTEERRAILAELADEDVAEVADVFADGEPVAPDRIEWFASPLDLCRALAILLERAETPDLGPVRAFLTASPGVPDVTGRWRSIAFKGGSEPGLMTAAWLVEAADGSRHALVGSVVDPEEAFDEVPTLLLLAAARDLLPAGGS